MKLNGRTICLLLATAWLELAFNSAAQVTNLASLIPPPIPPTPVLRSPVTYVRELLAMTPLERRQALSNRPPEIQKKLLAKLREYQSLKPDERELRLRATELQWYLQPLMALSPTNRAGRMTLVPEEMRPLLQERLARWDSVPSATQEELLNNEMTARYFTQLESATPEQKQRLLAQISPERRAKLEAGMDRWSGLSIEERDKMMGGFNAFFELTPVEKEKALGSLSDAEKRQMEKTMAAYEKLSDEQRAQCIRSFEKFAGMSLVERQTFLKNAERWKLMSPADRQSWRELVNVAPALPPTPAFHGIMPPMPKLSKARPNPSVATNSN